MRAGRVVFEVGPQEESTPPLFRLAKHEFKYELVATPGVAGQLARYRLTFPSPVKTPHAVNNTVHCEYYEPLGGAKRKPAAIVLHILGGDFSLSRLFCMELARRDVAALFVKMPYYGPRKVSGQRMISEAPEATVRGMRQAVLDIRRATAWLGDQPEVDANRLGVFGISLGGITAALTASVEPRLHNVCCALAGGRLGEAIWQSPELSELREKWEAEGKTRDEYLAVVRPIDPAVHGERARDRRILMINAKDDEVIPKQCTIALWKSFGEPPIIWYEGGHYTVARKFLAALREVGQFFERAESPKT
ncbi:MAG: alpha/beta hydrolase family protein [Pirellulaceae bacterium]|nr:alpha/beta hydrolase family protein [Pirellulaceae bacterium]MDP7014573.1 alpha/beta hydrolase family protein [Pirellulaceae bacterium]